MINRVEDKEVKITKRVISVVCDICNNEFTVNNVFELQEFHHIHFTGGYNSVFGDNSYIECDICQHCLYEIIKGKYRES